MIASTTEAVQLPKKLEGLFRPSRYKIVYGGRGAAKSYSFAISLLIQAAKQPLRILCTREVQKSIRDSVHRLLSDQVEVLGLGDFYDVLDGEIRGRNGSIFIFSGLSDHTVESIKSFEGIDICWCEEAQVISKRSWGILIPTIRKENSEIWISFNPELDTDETYVRFVMTPPPDAQVIEMSYKDNPWFPHVLEKERQYCKIVTPDDYDNIWEGACRKTIAGAIYAHEMMAMVKDGRICNVPYDPRLKVHTIWDLGWRDFMAVLFVQRGLSEVRIIDYMEEQYKTLDWMIAEIALKRYNWGWDWLPHDGFSGDYKTGKSAYEIMHVFGRRVKPQVSNNFPIPRLPVETGIKATRLLFPRIYVDQTKCVRLIECWKRYKRYVDKNNITGEPMHDEFSHGADATRGLALIVDKLTNDEENNRRPITPTLRPFDAGTGAL